MLSLKNKIINMIKALKQFQSSKTKGPFIRKDYLLFEAVSAKYPIKGLNDGDSDYRRAI